MTINKSQGQTLFKVGVYLPPPVFTHEHLSRVKTKNIENTNSRRRWKCNHYNYKCGLQEIFENL